MNSQAEPKVTEIYLDDIIPNRFQPRLIFDEKNLNELAASIKQHGVIQPITVRRVGDKYEVIAGERRCKAASIAGLQKIPAFIIDVDDNVSAEIAIIENIQRQDLNAIERALSYKNILDRGYLTQEQLAAKMGVTQASISNTLRLLNLDQEVQDAVLNKKISERHARSLLSFKNPADQREVLHKIISNKLTVKETDDLIRLMGGNIESEGSMPEVKPPNVTPSFIDIQPSVNEPPLTDKGGVDGEGTTNLNFISNTGGNIDKPPIINQELPKEDNNEKIDTLEINNINANLPDVEKIKEQATDITQVKEIPDFDKLLNLNVEQNQEGDSPQFKTEDNSEYKPTDNIQSRFITSLEDEETNMDMEDILSPTPSMENKEEENKEFTTSQDVPPMMPEKEESYIPPLQDNVGVDSGIYNAIPPQPATNTYINEDDDDLPIPDFSKPISGMELKDAINIIRSTINDLENNGLVIDTEEFDFENLYQIIIKINK